MKKQVFLRSLLGAFVGCFIGVVIIICISLAIGGGDMHVATPAPVSYTHLTLPTILRPFSCAASSACRLRGQWAGWQISPAGISSASSRCTPPFG